MRLMRKWNLGAVLLCTLGTATFIGCGSEAQIGGVVDFPPPAPNDMDGDGILDPNDKCPEVKEDGKPPDPNDGCPNLDEDGDGILVPQDKCPTEPETVNGFEDEDGCPDKKPLVEVTKEEIKINQKIMFGHDSADIQKESDELLDAVAETLKQNTGIQLVEVSGHASKEGADQYNRTLTQRRVDSVVKALTTRGVEADRLLAQGYGFHCPLVEGETPDAHEKNRRVEFRILYRDGAATSVERGCPQATQAGVKIKPTPALKDIKSAQPKAPAGKQRSTVPTAPPAEKQ